MKYFDSYKSDYYRGRQISSKQQYMKNRIKKKIKLKLNSKHPHKNAFNWIINYPLELF